MKIKLKIKDFQIKILEADAYDFPLIFLTSKIFQFFDAST